MTCLSKGLMSVFLLLCAPVYAMMVGKEISFVLPNDTSEKLIKAEISVSLAGLIGNTSPEQVKTVPAIAVYLERCKQAHVSDVNDAYLVFTAKKAIFVHRTWIKSTPKICKKRVK